MLAVVGCESNFTHYKTDGSVLRGRITPSDTGIMQISRDYWQEVADEMGLDLDNLYDNLRMGRHIYDTAGINSWVCNRTIAQR